MHCHSSRSDGLLEPEEVAAAYRQARYDYFCLSAHFEAEYGWQVTDTRSLRDAGFSTIIGAELSSVDGAQYLLGYGGGLPLDFEPPPPGELAEAIGRARHAGAFVVMLHPGLNNLPVAAADRLPGMDAMQAVEVYNHNSAMAASPDRAHGAYMLDGLLERGHRMLANAGDDAHFGHPADRFGGWVEVYCDRLDPGALLDALKGGRYYSTQGPALRELLADGERLYVQTSEAYDLAPFRGSYCRITIEDPAGQPGLL